jgi:cation diffusion facilitator CzcD-associated flavoprotein CzcO
MTTVEALVVGAGLSGIAAGVKLRREGIDDFAIIDKGPEFGGTWRANTYPGVACDVPSQVYSFAFAPSREWSRVFAPGNEIFRYLLDVVDRFELRKHARFGCEMLSARWNEVTSRWDVETTTGDFQARFLIVGTGPLEDPLIPSVPGLDSFPGRAFHSAQWPSDYDARGDRVAVIGTGASALQIFPEVAADADRIALFQRTPPWVIPKPDWQHSRLFRGAIRRFPSVAPAMRRAEWMFASAVLMSLYSVTAGRGIAHLARYNINRAIKDPEVRAALTPDYVPGCKRLGLSNTYYPALARPNATLIASGLAQVEGSTLIASNGASFEADTIIFSTGFQVADAPVHRRIFGRDGRSLAERWDGCPRAYKGITMSGCPNAFMLLGPNGLSSSQTVSAEAQAGHVAAAIRTVRDRDLRSIEVRESVEMAWKTGANRKLARLVHSRGGCQAFYLDRAGNNAAMYPSRTLGGVVKDLRDFDIDAYDVVHSRIETYVAS